MLSEAEVGSFIEHHIKAAGYRRKQSLFDADTIAAIFQHSRGIPRLIQNLALDAMLAAMAAGKHTVDVEAVQHAIVDAEGL